MATLLVLEPHCSGHRMQYVRSLSEAAAGRGHQVVVGTTPACREHPLCRSARRRCGTSLRVLGTFEGPAPAAGSGTLGLIRSDFAYRRWFRRAYRRAAAASPVDFVFVPYVDYFANAASSLGAPFDRTPWAGTVMRPAFHYAQLGVAGPPPTLPAVRRRLFLRLLRLPTLAALFTIDELLHGLIRDDPVPGGERLHYLPDPVAFAPGPTEDAAREAFDVPAGAPLILVYGSLTERKGIDALLQATGAPTFPGDVHVLLAGRMGDGVRASLDRGAPRALRDAGRLHIADRFLEDADETAAFRAADMVWLGYRGHSTMSGVLVQAAAMGKPVIACEQGLVGWLTEEYGLGLTVPIDNPIRVADAVRLLVRDADLRHHVRRRGQEYASRHDHERVFDALVDALPLDGDMLGTP